MYRDSEDNCRTTPNTDQKDSDEDGIGDMCDNCPQDFNNFQGRYPQLWHLHILSEFIYHFHSEHYSSTYGYQFVVEYGHCWYLFVGDEDGDGIGDVCDNCPALSNYFQADGDKDGIGDECDCDSDGSCDEGENSGGHVLWSDLRIHFGIMMITIISKYI